MLIGIIILGLTTMFLGVMLIMQFSENSKLNSKNSSLGITINDLEDEQDSLIDELEDSKSELSEEQAKSKSFEDMLNESNGKLEERETLLQETLNKYNNLIKSNKDDGTGKNRITE